MVLLLLVIIPMSIIISIIVVVIVIIYFLALEVVTHLGFGKHRVLTVSDSPISMTELIATDSLFPLRSISSTMPCTSPPGRPWKSIVAAEGRML